MFKIFKYNLYDLLRSRWLLIYFLFFFASSFLLQYFSSNFSKALVSQLNVEISIVPLVSILFGTMYLYNAREFIELLLAQPLKRKTIFLGLYFGLSISLSLCYLLGNIISIIYFGSFREDMMSTAFYLLTGILLTFIFTAFSFILALKNENRIKGFGFAILAWLITVVLFDALYLMILMMFQDYPLEKVTIALTILNPVDLSRILVLLNLEISALLGYSGEVFNQFFGTTGGLCIATSSMLVWIIVPVLVFIRVINKKNF